MAYIGQETDISMRPQKGDLTLSLPVTFDYSGGRADTKKSKIIWSSSLVALGLVAFIGVLTRSGSFLLHLILAFGIDYAILLIIRYVLWKENKIRRYYKNLDEVDYQMSMSDAWGIYSIDKTYPYVARYRNGMSGIFIRLNKDVILGKYSEAEYEHYEAIGDAYNIAWASNLTICHVDYMDNVGTDARIQESFSELMNVENPDVKDVLTDMFSHLQQLMNSWLTTYDVYVFAYRCSDQAAWSAIQRILSCLLDANYVNYRVLDSDDLRDLFRTLINVKKFSVIEAMMSVFQSSQNYSGVSPIKIIHSDGTEEVLNKTSEQKKEERLKSENEKELRKRIEKERKPKSRKGSKEKEENIDIF